MERIFESLIRSARPADGDTFVNVGCARCLCSSDKAEYPSSHPTWIFEQISSALMRMHSRRRRAAIGYYMLAAKTLQPTLGVIGFNPSVVMRERVGANFALNFPTAHSSSAESMRFCIDPRGMADKDDETMYIDSQFAGHLVSKEAKERCAAHRPHLRITNRRNVWPGYPDE